MTARPLISFLLITSLVLPSSLCAGTEERDPEAPNSPTTALIQQPISGQNTRLEEGNGDTESSQARRTVSLEEHEELKRKYRGAQNGVQIATGIFVVQTMFFCIALAVGWIKLYTDCKL